MRAGALHRRISSFRRVDSAAQEVTMTSKMTGRGWLRPVALVAFAAMALIGAAPRAEAVEQLRVATQFGLAYLPLIVMEHDKLWEAKAHALGADITVEYRRLGGGAALNDALLSDSVDLVAGGTAPMLFVWDRTAGSYDVEAIAALNSSPIDILTNKPSIKSLRDFGPDDKIAVPSIRVSLQAIVLMAAAEKEFGSGHATRLDDNEVGMQHPDALTALIAPGSEIAGYVSSSPYQEQALATPRVHKITDSFAAFDGPSTLSVVYGKAAFAVKHPKAAEAFYQALAAANASIAKDRSGAIDKYLEVTGDRTDRALLESILARPDFTFSTAPQGTLNLARFMHKVGLLKHDPKSWQDYFAEAVHGQPGS
jgi:NitT/TauT family transport system substrate-binding protein